MKEDIKPKRLNNKKKVENLNANAMSLEQLNKEIKDVADKDASQDSVEERTDADDDESDKDSAGLMQEEKYLFNIIDNEEEIYSEKEQKIEDEEMEELKDILICDYDKDNELQCMLHHNELLLVQLEQVELNKDVSRK